MRGIQSVHQRYCAVIAGAVIGHPKFLDTTSWGCVNYRFLFVDRETPECVRAWGDSISSAPSGTSPCNASQTGGVSDKTPALGHWSDLPRGFPLIRTCSPQILDSKWWCPMVTIRRRGAAFRAEVTQRPRLRFGSEYVKTDRPSGPPQGGLQRGFVDHLSPRLDSRAPR